MQNKHRRVLEKTERIVAEHMGDILSRISEDDYSGYLSEKIVQVCEAAEKEFGVDLSHSGLHYYYWNWRERKRLPTPRPVYFKRSSDVQDIWNKLTKEFGMMPSHHLAQVLLKDAYRDHWGIEILLGGESESEDQTVISVPSGAALAIHKWILDATNRSGPDVEQELSSLEKGLGPMLARAGEKLQRTLKNSAYEDPSYVFRTLIMSTHMSLYSYEEGRSYSCSFLPIWDGQYALGSFAGRVDSGSHDRERFVGIVKHVALGLLSYITYFEGMAAYEAQQSKFTRIDPKTQELTRDAFNSFLQELIFVDPKKTIKEYISFDVALSSERVSHKTGARQSILIVRLSVKSVDAFRFLYCEGAKNYAKIERHLESLAKLQKWGFERVRLDIAMDHKIARIRTLGVRSVQVADMTLLESEGKITREGIVHKFYGKYRDFLGN